MVLFVLLKKAFLRNIIANVAVKIIKYGEENKTYWETLLPTEIKLWKELSVQNHENVLMLKDDIRFAGYQYLITDVADRGNLFDLLMGGRPSEFKVKSLFKNILSAVAYCHSKGIAHRDIKPDNLLVARDDTIKLAGKTFYLSLHYVRDR